MTTNKIASEAITASRLAAGAVETVSLADSAVVAQKVDNRQIQLRLDDCPPGSFITSVADSGAVVCGSFDGNDFALSNQGCPQGQQVIGLDAAGQVVCEQDRDTLYSGVDFATSGQACEPGDRVTGIDIEGRITCETDVNTQYVAGVGLVLNGQEFSVAAGGITRVMLANGAVDQTKVDPTSIQIRLQSACPAGQFLVGIGVDGVPQCSQYDGTDFALADQNCPLGERVTGIDATGNVVCVIDENSEYTAGAGLTLAGSEFLVSDSGITTAKIADEAFQPRNFKRLPLRQAFSLMGL